MKSYQKSNIFAILVLMLFSVSLIGILPAQGYEPFAVETPLGSHIQVYTNPSGCSAEYGDTKILNSYSNLVQTSSFCVYISNPGNQSHILTLTMYGLQTVTVPQYDPSSHGYIQVNKTSYSLLINQYNRSVQNGDNIHNETGFSTYLIDKNVWSYLGSQVHKVAIVIHYDGYTGTFYFKTAFSNEPFVTTQGNIFIDAILLLIITLALILVGIAIFHHEAKKFDGNFPKYSSSAIGFWTLLLFVAMTVIYVLMQEAVFQAYDTLGWTALIIIYLLMTTMASFIIVGWTSSKNLYKVEVKEVVGVPFLNRASLRKDHLKKQSELRQRAALELQGINPQENIWESPTEETPDTTHQKPIFISHAYYQYLDKNGKKKYMVHPNSLGEMIARRFNGGINLNFKGAEIFEGRPTNPDDTEYTKEYIYCQKFKEIEKGIWSSTINLPNHQQIHITSIIFFLLSLLSVTTFLLAFVITNLALWVIDFVILLFAVGTLGSMYIIKSSGYSYDVQFQPLSQNVVMAAFDMMRTYQMNEENKDLLLFIEDQQMRMDRIAYDEWMRSQLKWNVERHPDNIKNDIDPQFQDAITSPNHYYDDFVNDPYKKVERLTRKYNAQLGG